jgi:asparagine synthase (glutamine-hydrolysing)
LLGERLADTGFFNTAYLKRLVSEHESGLRDYSASLWTLLMFDGFLRNVLDRTEQPPLRRTA